MDAKDLDQLRERIDGIDADLLRLLNERARCAEEVAAVKRRQDNPSFYRPDREAVILRQVRERNPGPLSGDAVVRIFREVMAECLALEQPLRVAYLGPEGTFTHLATQKHFGQAADFVALPSIDTVFREVESGRAQFGVVPIENSTEGVVAHTVDCFVESPLLICGEVILAVRHHLLSRCERIEEVERVLGHPQALAQCRQWLDRCLPDAGRQETASNARAAQDAAVRPGAAAIASEVAAGRYGLQILARNIEDRTDNTTRFLVLGCVATAPTGRDCTSVMLSTANRPGSLFGLLRPIAEAGISLSRIESRPSRCKHWDYLFFLDLIGHQQDPKVATCLAELGEHADLMKILGSYPQAAT